PAVVGEGPAIFGRFVQRHNGFAVLVNFGPGGGRGVEASRVEEVHVREPDRRGSVPREACPLAVVRVVGGGGLDDVVEADLEAIDLGAVAQRFGNRLEIATVAGVLG